MRLAPLTAAGAVGLGVWAIGCLALDPNDPGGARRAAARAGVAAGVVFHDRDGDGRRGPGEEGIPNVRVSNQRDVVVTDAQGRWSLPVGDDTALFVVKPRGWMTPVGADQLPRFYYLHKPAGSPKQRYPGVAPTGALPDSIDFALRPREEPERFRAIFFADPQPRNLKEVEYVAHDVVEELVGTDAAFGVTLGDILFDDLSIFPQLNGTIAMIGIPWYNVLGNHDQNYDSPDDAHADETFERTYGPSYYSFDHGPAHFVVLDDVLWLGDKLPNGKRAGAGNYKGGFGEAQIAWLRNDLALVPREHLVVLMMHIPLDDVADREEVFRLLEARPAVMSVSGHTHTQEHRFLTSEKGWRGPEPHHHVVNVTVSGSWWSGAPDERGIPHTLMRDGAPNGYSIVDFDGARASFTFKAASRDANYQMEIYAPESLPNAAAAAGGAELLVNVFAGSPRSSVEFRLDGRGPWTPMERVVRIDPNYGRLQALEKKFPHGAPTLDKTEASTHLWHAALPPIARTGEHRIDVRTRDVYGHEYAASRVIRVGR